jgi:GT2 family glycosyltransferase
MKQVEILIQRKLTLDIVIPCYRVDMSILDTILNLKSSATCSTMFIVIVDNPVSPAIPGLESRYGHRPDVRIRVNKNNLGASASRNRGIEESAAEWVHFLDDDVVPEEDILIKAEEVIRKHPKAAGFVGNSVFPIASTIFTTAVHLAGVAYFWDIAAKRKDDRDLPWGVTANLIARRNVKDGVKFDLQYPKTGGGEDIDFCRRKRDFMIHKHGGEGFVAAPFVKVTHPWWNNGKRSYWRFHYWSIGDGALVKQFPEHTYHDFAPNAAECLCLTSVLAATAALFGQWRVVAVCLQVFALTLIANILHDCYRHLYLHPERNENLNSSVNGIFWVIAVVESTFIRVFSEFGRLRGLVERGDFLCIGRRFDWFTGREGNGPMQEERTSNVQRVLVSFFLVYFFLS